MTILGKNRLNKLYQDYNNQENIIVVAKEKQEKINEKMINEVLMEFQDEAERTALIKQAKRIHYSEKKTEDLEKLFKNFNQDNIQKNHIADIVEIEKLLEKERKERSFFTKLANISPESED